MKSTELRVGNLVLHNKQIFEIYDIISTQDSVIIGQGDDTGGLQEVFISEIEPIQLTEDILLKCEFEKDDCFYHLNGIWISNFYEDYYSLDGFEESIIKFLHQLQNLYFSLTGQELYVTNLIN